MFWHSSIEVAKLYKDMGKQKKEELISNECFISILFSPHLSFEYIMNKLKQLQCRSEITANQIFFIWCMVWECDGMGFFYKHVFFELMDRYDNAVSHI